MRTTALTLSLLLALTASAGSPQAQFVVAFPALRFPHLLFLTAIPGSDELVAVSQDGVAYAFPNRRDVAAARSFLDIRDRVSAGGERGLLGLAFDPDYARNGFVYADYTAPDPLRTVIARFHVANGRADPKSEVRLLVIEQPYPNHNGGMLAFGPDRLLYVGMGDGGSGYDPHDNGQHLDTLLGKILRIRTTPGALVPPDNPFVDTHGARGEIWAYGMRNPWRFSFDRGSGALWAGDVGQDQWEEVDVITRGGDYGWRVFEGNHSNVNPQHRPASEFVAPVWEYEHAGSASITGGYVYRGAALPWLRGRYVYGDFVLGQVWALVGDAHLVRGTERIGEVPSPASFGEDATGELYACSYGGQIFQLVPR